MSIYVSRANKRGGSSSPVTPNSTMVSTSSSVEEVKAKLNFSLANRSPLLKTSSSRVSPYNVPLHNNKYHLREYHMSRQDPAVLDHMYFSNSHLDSTLQKSPPDTFNRPRHQKMGLPSAPLARAGQRQSVVMAALRKHVLTNNHSPPGVSSLVRLASQGPSTSSRNLTISPVVVHHSPINNEPPLLDVSKLSTPPSNLPAQPDPCDKNVVVSALKQKSRKRWFNKTDNHSLADEDLSGLSQPVAKKSRPHSVRDQLTNNLTPHKVVGIKRSNVASSLSTETLSKKPTLVTKRNRISLPDPNVEDNSQHSSSPVNVTVATEESEICSDESDPAKEEALLKLKQKLTQVFPSPSSGPSTCKRKKRPVYCATGSVMPLPPPSAYPVTAEDLRKDREEGLARIRRYLLSDNDNNQVSADNTQQVSSLALSTSSSALLSAGPLPTITTTTATIGNNITLSGGLSLGVTASASAPSILAKPVTTSSVGGSHVLGELGKLSSGDIAKQSSSGPSFFATSTASLLPIASNCNLVSSSESAAMLSFPPSVSSSSISASPMLCSRGTSTAAVTSNTTLVSSDASASSVPDSSCSKAASTGTVIDNSSITNSTQSSAKSEPLASGQQLATTTSSSALASKASVQGSSSIQLPETALPLNVQPQSAMIFNSQIQQASSTVASVSQSTNQANVLLSFDGSAKQSVASSVHVPSMTFGQQLNKPLTSQQSQQAVGMLFGKLQTATLPSSQLGAQQPLGTGNQQLSGFGSQQQPLTTGLQQPLTTGLSGFGLQQPSSTGNQQLSGFSLATGLQQPSATGQLGFGLQQQSSTTGLQQKSATGLQQPSSATGLLGFGLQQQSSTTGLQQISATGLQQPSATGLLGFGLQQQSSTTGLQQKSTTGFQQPSATGLLGFGPQQQSSTTGQQPLATGLLGFGPQQQSTTGQQPSATGLQQPSATGLQQPSATGLQQPSATGLQQPSITGLQQPSATGLQQPSITGLQQPSATGLFGFGLQQQPSATGLQQPSGASFGIQLSGGTKTLQFGATTQSSNDQTIGSPMQQASASVMFGANKSTVTASQQGSIFGGNNLIQSNGQQQSSSVNLFGGAGTSTSSAPTFQFGSSSSIQSSNLFGGNNAASISTASSMPSTFNFGLSSQSRQNSTTTTTTASTFQFGLPNNQTAAPSNTNIFGAQNQQKSMSGFSFSLGTQQQQQLSGATGQSSAGVSNKSSVPALGGFNFSANQSATNVFGGQSSTQQLMAGSTSGFNFSAATQTPSFNFAAGGNSKPSISRSSSKTAGRRRTKK